jgi:hypothetical protein
MGRELEKTNRREKIRKLLAKGYAVDEIVDKIAGDDARKRRIVSAQIHNMIHLDVQTQDIMGSMSKGSMIADTYEAALALGRRAKKGNIPAIKLLFEATGFYNPRIEHEHSGEININFKGLPRPDRHEDVTEADGIEDAQVVENQA